MRAIFYHITTENCTFRAGEYKPPCKEKCDEGGKR